ncbi:MAG: Regulatory protein AtoC [Myxococcota bacterium]|nr:Regulatory protein AtoC [Myxococcota bacterium]
MSTRLNAEPPAPRGAARLTGSSPVIQRLRQDLLRVAPSPVNVLITGESGAGKELIARAIHEESNRPGGPFVAINCSALPSGLIESELFGHYRGAFTGAVADRTGHVVRAHQGTLLLDEIGELPLDVQAKLLRVLQERVVDPLGATASIPVDVRVIAATHRNLEQLVEAGRFREDLYYRINVVHLRAPSLRERTGDIPELIEEIRKDRIRRHGLPDIRFTPGTVARLAAHSYPGNIRELINIVERLLIMNDGGTVEASAVDLPPPLHAEPPLTADGPLDGAWSRLEAAHEAAQLSLLRRAIETWPGESNTILAERLGVTRRVLEKRLKDFGLDKPRAVSRRKPE